jgi:crotonobetainyl-CoA:carnitine CoA-transferase CaiB-like acyl-CoA transferase
MSLYAAIVTALYRRQVTGQGGVVRSSLLANGLYANGCQVQAALCDLELVSRGPRGARNPLTDIFQAGDGRFFFLALINPGRDWPLFARAVGRSDWLEDPRYATFEARARHLGALNDEMEALFLTRPWAHWSEALTAAGLTFGVVGTTTDHLSDPQIEANGFLPEISDGMGLRTVDSPFDVVGEVKRPPRMAPEIGQHTRSVLEELGLSPTEIDALAS